MGKEQCAVEVRKGEEGEGGAHTDVTNSLAEHVDMGQRAVGRSSLIVKGVAGESIEEEAVTELEDHCALRRT